MINRKNSPKKLNSVEAYATCGGCTCYCGSYCGCTAIARVDSSVAESNSSSIGHYAGYSTARTNFPTGGDMWLFGRMCGWQIC